MAVLEKIRSKTVFLIAIIGLALFAFIISDFIGKGRFSRLQPTEIGTVNGEDVPIDAFRLQVENAIHQANGQASSIEAAKYVWEQNVQQILLNQQIEKLGYTGTENPTEMTHFVRGYVRERFLKADVGVNGCNFAVAASGTCTIVSNEGNGRMASSIPKTQVIFLGTERIVPDFKALDVMMEMLNRSAVGAKISNYFSMMTGPGRAGEADGPEETHIIIIDNGRSGILGGTFQEMLRCIRCGACMNICPVYRHISGHGYGSVYPGPMGAVLTPLFKGYDVAGDLPYASTLCGACTENCPVAIPLHELLMEHRHIMADIEKTRPKAEEAIFTAAAKMFGNSTLFDLGTKAGAIGMNLISNKEGNMPAWTQAVPVMNGWTKSKELGSLKFKKFRDLYAEHEKNKKKEKK